ncbi:MAG: hypothetical protein V4685_14460, partial [Bacteroidota bacterium]
AICITSGITAQKKTFMRMYDLQGKKFAKGYFAGTTDSTLLISKNDLIIAVAVSKIGFIKTKRTAGHTILVSSVIGAVSVGALGAATGRAKSNGETFNDIILDVFTYTPAQGFVAGFFSGAITGAVVGTVIGLLKKSVMYKIDGKQENWQQQKILIDKIPVYKPVSTVE